MKAIQHYAPVLLFIMLFKVVLSPDSVAEFSSATILKMNANKQQWVVPSRDNCVLIFNLLVEIIIKCMKLYIYFKF